MAWRLTLFKLQKNNVEKIFLTTNSLVDAKYTWIKRLLYHVIGVINLNEIKNWSEIKKSSTLKSSSLKQKKFETLNFLLELVDENKKNNEFEDSEKKISSIKFFNWILSMNRKTKKVKTREEQFEEVLHFLEKIWQTFKLQLTKEIKQYKNISDF